METINPEQTTRYREALNTQAELNDLPQAAIEDIELHAPTCTPTEAERIYREWGCLVVRGLLADLVPEILADLEEMVRQVKESDFTRTGSAAIREGGQTGREKQIMLFCPTYVYASSHFRAATDARVLDLLEAMIGPNIEMFGTGMAMYKEPEGGMEKSLHQDAPYFYHREHSVCSAFVHLVPTDEKNGCLRVVPGSFKFGLLEHEDSFSDLALPKEKFPLQAALAIHAQPGDAVFFNYLTIHGSDNNRSDAPRPGLVLQIDGEEVDSPTPLVVEILPQALRVRVPATTKDEG